MVSSKVITQSLTVFQLFCLQVVSRCWHSLFHHPCEQLSISTTFCQRVHCASIINSKINKMFYMFLFMNNSDNNKKINNTRQQVQFVHAYTTNVWSGSPVSLWLFFGGYLVRKIQRANICLWRPKKINSQNLIQTQTVRV